MINVEHFIDARFPELYLRRPLFFKTLAAVLKQIFHESEFQQFEQQYPHLSGFDFVEQVLQYFDFSYSLVNTERERILLQGRLVVIANHPIGSLDGLALLKLVGEVRKDVKVVANEVLSSLKPLHALLLPVDNMGGKTARSNLKAIHEHLENEGVVIIFPAGEVSRFGGKGVRDGKWNSGFLKIASSTRSPILPIYVDGRNSILFYSLSFLAKPLSTLWLINEMFKQSSRTINVRIGTAIRYENYHPVGYDFKHRTDLFKRHVYRLQKRRNVIFSDLPAIAHPEDRKALRQEINACALLGKTHDGMQIRLYHYQTDSHVMREIGRLREISFRAVGEGSGHRRDVDRFDAHYEHIVLWDDAELEIVGSYRIASAAQVMQQHGITGLYSATLFDYHDAMAPVLEHGLELGRSFVQPRYWGKRSLDYLWFGIGAYLRQHPEIRYLFGPVSISADYDEAAKAALIHLYSHYFRSPVPLATAKTCFNAVHANYVPPYDFSGDDYKADFLRLKEFLATKKLSVPMLYKQYIEVYEANGIQFADFNVDPDFSNCVDGLVIADLSRLKPKKRERYIDNPLVPGK
jgi:putative hemolysin